MGFFFSLLILFELSFWVKLVILHVCVNLYINTILSLIILGCFYTAELWFNFIYLMCTFSLVVLFIFHRFLYNLCIEQEQSVGWGLSDQISRSVVSDSFRPHESQHARPPCPSPTPRVHSDSHPSSQWCHPAISSSGIPFSSCPQFLPASESFPMSQLFAWGGQSTGVSALASFLPKKSQG